MNEAEDDVFDPSGDDDDNDEVVDVFIRKNFVWVVLKSVLSHSFTIACFWYGFSFDFELIISLRFLLLLLLLFERADSVVNDERFLSSTDDNDDSSSLSSSSSPS